MSTKTSGRRPRFDPGAGQRSSTYKQARRGGVLVKLKVGGLSGNEPRPSPNDEFAFVYQGEVVLSLDETEYLLASGDSAVIPAGVKRRWRNDTLEAVQILIVSAKSIP